MINTIKLLFLIAGIYLVVAGYMVLGLICFAIAIGLTFLLSLSLLFVGMITVLMLSGCATDRISINQFTQTKNIYIDNTAVNNFVGNPCAFYLGDHCLLWKNGTLARDPNNPYKGK